MSLRSLAVVATLGFLHSVQAKAVFAHYMVSNTLNYTTNDFESEISLAQNAKIDAFALNFAHGEVTTDHSLPLLFDTANRLDFKLFFSFDYAGNGTWPQQEVIDLIQQYSSETSYFKRESKPLVSTFEGVDNAEDWPLIKEKTGCFFMPSWSSKSAKDAVGLADGVADGLFSWAAWPNGAGSIDTSVDKAYQLFLYKKPYMMPVSPWFYTNLPGYNKNWVWRGDDLWFDRWNDVLDIKPEYVEIISWNDYGESHYIGPLNDKGYVAFKNGKAPFNYVENMPHDGWRMFLPYVIDMYKNGNTTITQEGVVSWYRQTSHLACATGGTAGNNVNQSEIEMAPSEISQDRIFVSALLASNATLTVSIGGEEQQGTWTTIPDGGVGLYHGSVPFGARTGKVKVKVARAGATAVQMDGVAIRAECPDGVENWNAWVGNATGAAVSVTVPVVLAPSATDPPSATGTGDAKSLGHLAHTSWYVFWDDSL